MKKNTGIYTWRGLFLVASLMLAFAIAICGVMTAGGLLSNKAAYAEAAAEPPIRVRRSMWRRKTPPAWSA